MTTGPPRPASYCAPLRTPAKSRLMYLQRSGLSGQAQEMTVALHGFPYRGRRGRYYTAAADQTRSQLCGQLFALLVAGGAGLTASLAHLVFIGVLFAFLLTVLARVRGYRCHFSKVFRILVGEVL